MLEWGALDRPFKAIKIWLAEKIGFSEARNDNPPPHENIDTRRGNADQFAFQDPDGCEFLAVDGNEAGSSTLLFPARSPTPPDDNLFAGCCTTMPSWRNRRINVKPCGSGI